MAKKASISFPEDMTTDELDDAIRSLISDGELKPEDAWEIRERAIRSPKRKSDSKGIMDRIKKGCISIEELSSDIEELISRLDGCADGMRNSAHFEMKAVVHGYRKKYGIKAKTYVQCNEMCGGRMPIEKYLKKERRNG